MIELFEWCEKLRMQSRVVRGDIVCGGISPCMIRQINVLSDRLWTQSLGKYAVQFSKPISRATIHLQIPVPLL